MVYIKWTAPFYEIGLMSGNSDLIKNGHKSGPGIMWSYDDCFLGYDTMKRSYFWGDHVFINRLAPTIP